MKIINIIKFIFVIILFFINSCTETPDEYYRRGNDALASEKYESAIDYFTSALKFKPNHPIYLYYRGLAKYKLKDYHGAIADFAKMIEIKPHDIEAQISRGFSKYELGDKEGAKLDFSRMHELGPKEKYELINRFNNIK